MGDVKALARTLHLPPDAFGLRIPAHEHGDHGRSVKDYHGVLIDVAGIVGVPEPTYRHVRRLVQLDRFPLT